MSSFIGEEKKRKLIPRWHTYDMAKWLGILGNQNDREPQIYSLNKSLEEWSKNKTVTFASELIGKATHAEIFTNIECEEAAKFLIENQSATYSSKRLAESFLKFSFKGHSHPSFSSDPEATAVYYKKISTIKNQLKFYPQNKILWSDLAFFYSTLGQSKKAQKSMDIAISNNYSNRFLVLSAVRCFLHLNLPERALFILKKSIQQTLDPWFLSAEIATSTTIQKSPQSYKRGKNFLKYSNAHAFHRSELAASIGTLEYDAGNKKQARKLINESLEVPTENTLAQVAFLRKQYDNKLFKDKIKSNYLSYEADTNILYQGQKFEEALTSVKKWINYQPFSSRATILGSFLASVALENFNESEKIAKLGLLSSPNDYLLKNNFAFSLINNNKLADAKKIIEQLDFAQTDEYFKCVFNATKGALEFKSNNKENGRVLYEEAIRGFAERKDARSEAIALYFWIKEELIQHDTNPTIRKMIQRLSSLIEKNDIIELSSKKLPGLCATTTSRKKEYK